MAERPPSSGDGWDDEVDEADEAGDLDGYDEPEDLDLALEVRERKAIEGGETHRGAFGEFGGEGGGLLDRAFRERIVIVGVAQDSRDAEHVEADLDELEALIDTAGADVVDRVVQRRARPDPATLIGRGKAAELADLSEAVDADTVVFDDELSPAQQRNLEKLLGRSAIDRTAVILDIFAQHAHSTEGKAQVELAQLQYLAPRLRGRGKALSQQAGGLGGARRGPGETQLETDRRKLQRRVHKLEDQLRHIAKVRQTQAKSRRRSRHAEVAIVGYTNAGKSTLLNRLTDAGVLVQDALFATLDATTRRLDLPGGESVLVSDTVGFVKKLPHQLVEAFRSTLQVAIDADLLVHVVDSTSADPEGQILAVREVLAEIGADHVPELLVFNKADDAPAVASREVSLHPGSVAISAQRGEGIDVLLRTIGDRLRARMTPVELLVPYERGDVVAAVHREGEVLVEQHTEGGTRLRARLDEAGAARFEEFVIS